MSVATYSRAWLAGGFGGSWRRLGGFAERHRALWPALGLAVAGLIAYHFTLGSLLDFLRLDTPLAYLPLLPLACLGTIYVLVRRYETAPAPIQDRQVDLLIGIPMLLLAILLLAVVPSLWSTYYWSERPDVVSLALFVSAGVVLFYGFNWFWRLRGPLLFLFLMWPALYLHVMAGVLAAFTNATNGALAAAVHRLPLGAALGGAPGDIIVTIPHAAPITINIGTACSGASAVLGFALIGAALLLAVEGRRVLKLTWWLAGMVLAFLGNVIRLASIILLAHDGQPSFALGGYHALIGMVLFAIVVMLMTTALPLFGLRWANLDARPRRAPQARVARSMSRLHWGALAAFGVLTVGLTAADHDLRAYASFADGSGAPTVAVFGSDARVGQMTTYRVDSYPWATQYFGASSDFTRWAVIKPGTNVVWADVVRTDDKGALDAYNLTNCFLFHNYDITTSKQLDLGNGVTGLLLNYTDPPTKSRWATVSWAWPVRYKGTTYYERIAMTSALVPGSTAAPDLRPGDGLRALVLNVWNGLAASHISSTAAKQYLATDSRLQEAAVAVVDATVRRSGN